MASSSTRHAAPAVPGEVIEGDVAAYHCCPGRDRVVAWLAEAHLDVLEETYVHARNAWAHRHFLLRTPIPVPIGSSEVLP